MLTKEQIKQFAELFFRVPDVGEAKAFKLRLCYLKENKLCRLGYRKDFLFSFSQQQLYNLSEEECKSLIPDTDWQAFTDFVNDNESLSEYMLIHNAYEFQKTQKVHNLGTYKMIDNGIVRDIDAQANVKALYECISESCKAFE